MTKKCLQLSYKHRKDGFYRTLEISFGNLKDILAKEGGHDMKDFNLEEIAYVQYDGDQITAPKQIIEVA